MKRTLFYLLPIIFCAIGALAADQNVSAAQARLKAEGFYFGEPNGTVDAETSAAISRYQIRNGLQITGQLDAETAKRLGVSAAPAAANAEAAESGSWQQLRKSDRQFLERLESTKPGRKPGQVGAAPATSPAAQRTTTSIAQPAPAVAPAENSNARSIPAGAAPGSAEGPVLVLSRERLRDYVGAFVLAGLDPRPAAELEFFADRVDYYDQGTLPREKIRADLQRYNEQWPQRRFWLAGEIDVQPQEDSRVRVTFPLRYQLRNGSRLSVGEIRKTLLLEVVGEDLQIASVSERKIR
ncbi:MAG TPA: peptidoglycan-binding domain-containing protein [Chthoniobacterales bacterium]|nr:peptidoglycan-binding domain-containing protein [Chthoniobacterales bacterium]